MNIAEIKANARRALHGALSVSAALQRADGTAVTVDGEPATVTVRWHSKTMLYGADASDGYAQTIEGLDSVIFNAEELAEKGIEVRRGDKVVMPAAFQGAVLVLQEQEPLRGPVELKWRVAQQ